MIELKIYSLEESEKLARLLAKNIKPNMVCSFVGTLGAGKTTIIRSILRHMGIGGSIKSPTFTIVEPYQINDINIYHFDLYRIDDASSWYDLGFDDYFTNSDICFIEWAEKAEMAIPKIDIVITIDIKQNYRNINISAKTELGRECLQNLTKNVENF
jgi:tRNA threonylcarbamoyladenosine biosynthesis protein TsaE